MTAPTWPVSDKDSVRTFYNEFATKFVSDFVRGNRRIAYQKRFFQGFIPVSAKRILIVGCGSGEVAYFLATNLPQKPEIVALDLSDEAIQLARTCFSHPSISYRQGNCLELDRTTDFDAILFPDVYEHIPVTDRDQLHAHIKTILSTNGCLLFTCPTPAYQAFLRATGGLLQIVDEDVTTHDLLGLATAVGAQITYFKIVSVWRRGDYFHAAFESSASSRISSITTESDGSKAGVFPHLISRVFARFGSIRRSLYIRRKLKKQPARMQ